MPKLPAEIRAEIEKAQMFIVGPHRAEEMARQENARQDKGMEFTHLDAGAKKGYADR